MRPAAARDFALLCGLLAHSCSRPSLAAGCDGSLAAVFHWPPQELRRMTVSELAECQRLALERIKALEGLR